MILAGAIGCAAERAATTWADDARDGIGHHARPSEGEAPKAAKPPAWSGRFALDRQDAVDGRDDRVSSQELELAILRFTSKRRALMSEPAGVPGGGGQRAAVLGAGSNGAGGGGQRAGALEASGSGAGVAGGGGQRAGALEAGASGAGVAGGGGQRAGALEAGGSGGAWPRPMESAWTALLEQLEAGFAKPAGEVPRRLLIQARVSIEVELETTQARYGRAPQAVAERVGRIFGAIAVHMRSNTPIAEERSRWAGDIELSWPVSPLVVTSPFGYRRDPILGRESVRFHAGVDLGGSEGDLVTAAGPGRVVSAGWLGGHGRTVIIQHPSGYQTVYSHLRLILISAGAEVDPRCALGYIGSSGRSTGPHLHFEVRHGGVPIDPLEIVDIAVSHGEKRRRDGVKPWVRASR